MNVDVQDDTDLTTLVRPSETYRGLIERMFTNNLDGNTTWRDIKNSTFEEFLQEYSEGEPVNVKSKLRSWSVQYNLRDRFRPPQQQQQQQQQQQIDNMRREMALKDAEINRYRREMDLKDNLHRREMDLKDAEINLHMRENNQMKEEWSLRSALHYLEELELKNHGTDSSHVHPNHLPAEAHERKLSLLEVRNVLTVNPEFLEKMGRKQSAVSFKGTPDVVYTGEADIQQMVDGILKDSLAICCILLELDGQEKLLQVRREASLLSNYPDHSVVYIRDMNTPLFTVESKKPHEKAMTAPCVNGQVFDQLCDSIFLSWNNAAVGAITTIKETRAAWIGTRASELFTPDNPFHDLFSRENREKAKKMLVNQVHCQTPPPKKMRDPRPGMDMKQDDLKLSASGIETRAKKPRRTPKREILVSGVLAPRRLVDLFCTLTIAGILLKEEEKQEVDRLPGNTTLEVPCSLVFKRDAQPSLEELGEVHIKGPAKRKKLGRGWNSRSTYYVLSRLGTGATSKAFRALTSDMHECVLKVYIAQYDEEGCLIPTFKENGKQAIQKECKSYERMYPDLKEHVWTESLCHRHCLVLPFFEPIKEEEREEENTKKTIMEKYNDMLMKGYMYKETDVRWQHIGRFKDEVYLFDLGGLVASNDSVKAKNRNEDCGVDTVEKFWHLLMKRLEPRP